MEFFFQFRKNDFIMKIPNLIPSTTLYDIGTKATVVGWGSSVENPAFTSLKATSITTIPNHECRNLCPSVALEEDQFCGLPINHEDVTFSKVSVFLFIFKQFRTFIDTISSKVCFNSQKNVSYWKC